MPVNLSSLKTKLQQKINALQNTDAEELLLLSTSVSNLTDDRIITVETENDLPDLQSIPFQYTLPSGSIFFVKSLNVLVISCKARWIGLDGRLLRDDGIPVISYAWGSNNAGRLGDGTIVDKSSPVSVIGGITNWSQVSGGNYHSLGVTSTGIAYAWGFNGSGRLGDGTIVAKSSPVSVIGGIANWAQVSAGNGHSLGVTSTGIAYAWGYNGHGRLGDGTIDSKTSPVSVVGGITNWSQVSAGWGHSLGLTSTGIAYAWGNNSAGQLGDGTIASKRSPVSVIGGITNWAQVSAGGIHSLGVTSTGIAYAWGFNGNGRLGDGTIISKTSPVSVIGGITNWAQVSAGDGHSLGVTSTGIAYAWGYNGQGRLGDGTTVNKSSPVSVIGGITNWSQVSAGWFHSLGVTSTGIAYAWGSNGQGRLGDGTTVTKSSPVSVVGGITNWLQVSAGNSHSLALKTS